MQDWSCLKDLVTLNINMQTKVNLNFWFKGYSRLKFEDEMKRCCPCLASAKSSRSAGPAPMLLVLDGFLDEHEWWGTAAGPGSRQGTCGRGIVSWVELILWNGRDWVIRAPKFCTYKITICKFFLESSMNKPVIRKLSGSISFFSFNRVKSPQRPTNHWGHRFRSKPGFGLWMKHALHVRHNYCFMRDAPVPSMQLLLHVWCLCYPRSVHVQFGCNLSSRWFFI